MLTLQRDCMCEQPDSYQMSLSPANFYIFCLNLPFLAVKNIVQVSRAQLGPGTFCDITTPNSRSFLLWPLQASKDPVSGNSSLHETITFYEQVGNIFLSKFFASIMQSGNEMNRKLDENGGLLMEFEIWPGYLRNRSDISRF